MGYFLEANFVFMRFDLSATLVYLRLEFFLVASRCWHSSYSFGVLHFSLVRPILVLVVYVSQCVVFMDALMCNFRYSPMLVVGSLMLLLLGGRGAVLPIV